MATHCTYTYIHLFVGNGEILGEFLVLNLNLLGGLTPSVELKPFRKLKTEVVRPGSGTQFSRLVSDR